MLIGFSQLGYESYRKLQGSFIDFETGEILNKAMWDEKMSDEIYAEYLYGMRWSNIRSEITEAEKNVKYWYYVDHKANRGLCNQTIRGTREYDGKTYKINKLDIRTQDGFKRFKELAFSEKESDRERLLVYKNDRRTFDDLVQIMKDYSDAVNPFVQYEKETGDYVRKYAKNHKGPRIDKLKYMDGEVGSCIDISHKYGYAKGSRKVILESLVPYRMDVYYKEAERAYYLVGVKQSDVRCENGVYMIDEDAYAVTLVNEKMIKQGQIRADLEKLGYEFRMSFYRNDIIEYEKDGKLFRERFLSRTKPNNRNYIETKPINRAKYEKQNLVGLGKTKKIKKYRMDILGNYYSCEKEEFSKYC
jgi:CRISPR-associated endonuclease Csn1